MPAASFWRGSHFLQCLEKQRSEKEAQAIIISPPRHIPFSLSFRSRALEHASCISSLLCRDDARPPRCCAFIYSHTSHDDMAFIDESRRALSSAPQQKHASSRKVTTLTAPFISGRRRSHDMTDSVSHRLPSRARLSMSARVLHLKTDATRHRQISCASARIISPISLQQPPVSFRQPPRYTIMPTRIAPQAFHRLTADRHDGPLAYRIPPYFRTSCSTIDAFHDVAHIRFHTFFRCRCHRCVRY